MDRIYLHVIGVSHKSIYSIFLKTTTKILLKVRGISLNNNRR